MKGNSFFTLHEKYEELYNDTAQSIDQVAERILMLGEKPIGSLKDALEIATIKEREAAHLGGDESIKIAVDDLKLLEADARKILRSAGKEDDDVTADLFTGYAAAYQKLIWLLGSHLSK